MIRFWKENDYFPLLNAWTTDTWVCSLVRPRIHKICPARGFLSSKESNRSSPKLIASVYSSGCPRPHLYEREERQTTPTEKTQEISRWPTNKQIKPQPME